MAVAAVYGSRRSAVFSLFRDMAAAAKLHLHIIEGERIVLGGVPLFFVALATRLIVAASLMVTDGTVISQLADMLLMSKRYWSEIAFETNADRKISFRSSYREQPTGQCADKKYVLHGDPLYTP